jgi:hypothetical protein
MDMRHRSYPVFRLDGQVRDREVDTTQVKKKARRLGLKFKPTHWYGAGGN